MEDLEDPGTPVLDTMDEPQGNQDPGDPLQPDIEEEHEPNAPIGNPTADPDTLEDDNLEDQPEPDNDPALDVDMDDDDSELDELDEAQFDDFDPSNIVVPVAVDETNVGLLGVHKRKRTEEEERERKKKKKEGRRERVSKKTKKRDEADVDGERTRSGRKLQAPRRAKTPENEEDLTPEERRRRALDRKLEEALQTNKPTRRKNDGIDVQDQGEAELETMRLRMADAAQRDNEARKRNEPASHKLMLLPKVVDLLNRNMLQHAILDPDINVLEAVRFFLEPADEDAALPNYQIQREMFKVLANLRMTKEALIASGIGKVVMYYTKSNQPQPGIKRQAEKLLQAWMAVILNKKRSSKAQQVERRTYDPFAVAMRSKFTTSLDPTAIAEEKRRKALALPIPGNRARLEGGLGVYTVAPENNLASSQSQVGRRMGTAGEHVFKKMASRAQIKTGGVGKK